VKAGSGALEELTTISPPWRVSLELSWDAYCAGSAPVGAVVTDASGAIVAHGRSRWFEPTAPSGQLANTHLAHAEVNALAGLTPGNYEDHTLYTTLEPCLLCTAATIHSHVGTVKYAASDPLWEGLRRLPELNQHISRRWPRWDGPLVGPIGGWSLLLAMVWHLQREPDSVVVRAYEGTMSDALAIARRTLAAGIPAKGGTLDDAMASASPLLEPGPS
jgi:tRNA(adenine34) deaminase